MKNYLLRYVMFFLIAGVTSCVKSELSSPEIDPKESSEIILRIQTPGSFSAAKTRGLSLAQESDIEDIWVLAFDKSGTLADIRKGENLSSAPAADEPNIRSFTAKLKQSENASDTYKLMVLANCDGILASTIGTDIEAVTGDLSYEGIISRLYDGVGSKMYPSGGVIPMWGETQQILLEKNGSTVNLKLMRAIARIDVGIGTRIVNGGSYSWSGNNDKGEKIPFELTDVHVISPTNAYSVVPAAINIDSENKITTPTLPTGAESFAFADSKDKFHYTGEDITQSGGTDESNMWGSYTTQRIYVPEANVKLGDNARSGDANHEKRMAIVVGGKYGNSSNITYYRIDFARDGNIMDVLRNHLYQFNIKKVSGAGYNDVESAYRSMATNMAVEILEWDDAEMNDIVFDGQYYFSITSRKVEFSPMGDEIQTIKMKTNVTDFEMFSSVSEKVELKAISKQTYRHEEMGYDYKLTNVGGDEYELVIKAEKHNVSNTIPNRLEKWSIRAGRLNMSFEVDQQYTVLYISYVNGASATLMPEGTAGTVKIPIHIMALKRVVIETLGDEDGKWIELGDISGLTTSNNGLYTARLDVTIPTCPVMADNKKIRQGMIRVTPENEDPRVFNITQEAPFLSFIKTTEIIPRKIGTTYTTFVEVNTNIRQEDLEITRSNPQGPDESRITVGSAFYNVDATRPRLVRFDVKTDMTTSLQLTESSADFSVKIKEDCDYGALTPPVITCVIERTSLKFNWYWRRASINGTDDYRFLEREDETMTYIYPWQTTNVTFDLTTNIGGEFDKENPKNKQGAGSVNADTKSTDADGNDVIPYVFTFNNSNYGSKGEYTLFFKGDPEKNEGKEYSKDIFFRQGVQMWNRTTLPNSGNVGSEGLTKGSTKIDITGNVEWSASIGSWNPSESTSWLALREGETGAWTTPSVAVPLKIDSRITAPQEHSGVYPVENVLTKQTPIFVAVEPYNTLNATPESRSAQIAFTNLSIDADKGGAIIAQPTIKVTQYAPVLAHVSNEMPTTIPGGGGTYNVVARTNMQGWGVKVYNGSENSGSPIVNKSFGTATTIPSNQAAVNRQLPLAIPANPGATNRTLSYWLYCSEFPGAENEEKFAENQQVVALNMTIATTSRNYTAGTVSQIVISDPGDAGWKLSTSGDWLQTSNSSGGGTSTTELTGFGNSTDRYVYVSQNGGRPRTGTITLKTQSGTVIKSITITQTEAPPVINSLEGGVINAQGRGKEIKVTVQGNATLSVNNGFGISTNRNPTSQTSVNLTAGSYTYYVTANERFGKGEQYGVVTLQAGSISVTKNVQQHTCVSLGTKTTSKTSPVYVTNHTAINPYPDGW